MISRICELLRPLFQNSNTQNSKANWHTDSERLSY